MQEKVLMLCVWHSDEAVFFLLGHSIKQLTGKQKAVTQPFQHNMPQMQ